MRKQKWIPVALAFTIGLGGTYSTAGVPQVQAAEVEAVFSVSADVSVQQDLLADFEEIKSFFAEEDVDLEAVKAFYDEHFAAVVQERDALAHEQISAVLQLGVEGEATAGQVKQAVDKGLQWFFYNEIRHFDREAGNALAEGNTELAMENLDKAIALFEGSVYVTAGKRDNNFNTLTQDFFQNIAVPGMRDAIENEDVTTFHVYRQYFEKTMMKVFVLATIRYAEIVPEDHAAGNTEQEKAHLAEGYFFFMPIHDYLASGSKEAADQIKEAFGSGDGANVEAETIKTLLARAIGAKVNGYVDEAVNVDLASGDLERAKIHAAEANAFASQLEVILEERLGEEAYAELQTHGEAFSNAVAANDAAEARKHGFALVKLLAELSGVHFTIGGKSLSVMGEVQTTNEVTSYLDPSTNRTLASVRFISEALGATVDWIDSEKKVKITKENTTIEFVIGSTDVYVNGEMNEDYTLDQPAVLNQDRTYIPLRATAELLGGHVLWHDGEVIIHY